jgi:hypothetical protein
MPSEGRGGEEVLEVEVPTLLDAPVAELSLVR